jgi:transcriptional regulator of acetoin/glycerol metabolism
VSKRADEADARAVRLEARVRQLTDELDARTGYRRVVATSARAAAVGAACGASRRDGASAGVVGGSAGRGAGDYRKSAARCTLQQSVAARALGLTRTQLYVRLRKHGLE